MNIFSAVKIAFHNIRARKMRSFLTMLGIIIGVAAVISLVSIGRGSSQQVTEQVKAMGTNLLTVNISGRGTQTSVEYDQVMSLKGKDGIKDVAPVLSQNTTLATGNKNTSASVEGINDAYETVRNTHVQAGRFLLPIDMEYRSKVALIGTSLARELFGEASPVGQKLYINGKLFKVVGLLEEKGGSMMGSVDDKVLIPFSTAERLFKTRGVSQFYVQAESESVIFQAESKIERMLTGEFRGDSNSFRINNQQEMLDTMSSISDTMSNMLGGIAGISLFVGGIGIMNMMLVSVTERTREIGIRKAVGANTTAIMIQFLIEAITLSGLGGGLGLLLGIASCQALSSFLDISVQLSLDISAIAFGFSCIIGIIFGIFPARKAAKLDPVEALRYE
ncbi:ABC transporter permease [Paenactinomyces guangxiensis]|uniref:ABC transporter permease n=1 Tax=Paenactinomyces guangxiensis TaxID=1490290 RepID=A0A7W1WPV6_9BACL|nr:ABC transporter permease [Paenactinomyces guangxiensis]MBA4493869.1 ABC transporter permease [Paenactinomyces guangxiensis]MBH8591335.1 ABC transporter permease [Paenactinomyces guangxiensis]